MAEDVKDKPEEGKIDFGGMLERLADSMVKKNTSMVC